MSDFLYERDGGSSLRIEDNPLDAYVAIFDGRGTTSATISKPKRQAAAQAVAGDGYHVVPARDSDDGWIAVQRSEYERLLDRDEFPRVQGICPSCGVGPLFLGEGGHVTCSWVDCEAPEAADETLQIGLTVAQPDRAEPVDPASVQVGDVVEIEADDGSWMVRGRVDYVNSGDDRPICISVPFNYGQIWPKLTDATVRILHAAEPVPDEAAVEALAEALRDVYPRAVWDLREGANLLARRGVRVVSTDE